MVATHNHKLPQSPFGVGRSSHRLPPMRSGEAPCLVPAMPRRGLTIDVARWHPLCPLEAGRNGWLPPRCVSRVGAHSLVRVA